MSTLSERLRAVDVVLVRKRFPALSPWWLATLTRFLDSKKRQLTVRAGRRGGKSSSVTRALVVLGLYGQHDIPPGDVGVVAIVSVSREEAAQRLRLIRAILDALEIPYREDGDSIEIVDTRGQPIVFRVFTASLAGVVGFTAIAILADEVAKWRDRDSGANPAKEVLASLRPTMATQPHGRRFLVSSPVGTKDAHAVAFSKGDTVGQMTAEAASWVANPTLTEAETRADEPDERVWLREYAAIPQAAALAAFDTGAVDRAFRPRPAVARARRVLVLDPSSGRKDAWTWAIVGWSKDAGGEFLEVDAIDAVTGAFWKQADSGDEIVDRIAALAKREGISTVHGDQRESLMLMSAFQRRGLRYVVHDWTGPKKVSAIEVLRRLFRESKITICDHERTRRELYAFEEKILPSGSFSFAGRGDHDDHVALLITGAIADSAGLLERAAASGTPIGSVLTGDGSRYADVPTNWF